VQLTGAQPSLADLQAQLLCGPHKSALKHVNFVQDEFADFCQQGFWTVLPFDCVKDLPNLQFSPLGVVPQCSRHPHLTVDLSFWGINEEMLRDAPIESMQFGQALERILIRIRHANPKYGPVHISKQDILDGFCRVPLAGGGQCSAPRSVVAHSARGATSHGYSLRLAHGVDQLLPIFCAITKTVANIANDCMALSYIPPLQLERLAATPTKPPWHRPQGSSQCLLVHLSCHR